MRKTWDRLRRHVAERRRDRSTLAAILIIPLHLFHASLTLSINYACANITRSSVMPSSLLRSEHDAAASPAFTLAVTLLIASFLAQVGAASKHALLTSAVAWLSICAYTTLRAGARSLLDGSSSQRLAWGAGALLAVAGVCERAVDSKGIWWAKVNCPLAAGKSSD